MAWDSSRPIPWKQLLRLIAIFLVLFNAFLYFQLKSKYNLSTAAGTLLAGGAYLMFSIVLAKFGLDPVTQRARRLEAMELRRAEKAASSAASPRSGKKGSTQVSERPRPPATGRTNAGNRQAPRKK